MVALRQNRPMITPLVLVGFVSFFFLFPNERLSSRSLSVPVADLPPNYRWSLCTTIPWPSIFVNGSTARTQRWLTLYAIELELEPKFCAASGEYACIRLLVDAHSNPPDYENTSRNSFGVHFAGLEADFFDFLRDQYIIRCALLVGGTLETLPGTVQWLYRRQTHVLCPVRRSEIEKVQRFNSSSCQFSLSLLPKGANTRENRILHLEASLCKRKQVWHTISMCTQPLWGAISEKQVELWLRYHIALGVEFLYFYDRYGKFRNLSQPYVDAGVMEYIHFPLPVGNSSEKHSWSYDQFTALHHCVMNGRHHKWMLYLDWDEFLHLYDLPRSELLAPSVTYRRLIGPRSRVHSTSMLRRWLQYEELRASAVVTFLSQTYVGAHRRSLYGDAGPLTDVFHLGSLSVDAPKLMFRPYGLPLIHLKQHSFTGVHPFGSHMKAAQSQHFPNVYSAHIVNDTFDLPPQALLRDLVPPPYRIRINHYRDMVRLRHVSSAHKSTLDTELADTLMKLL